MHPKTQTGYILEQHQLLINFISEVKLESILSESITDPNKETEHALSTAEFPLVNALDIALLN